MTPATYSAEFAGGFRATLTISPDGAEVRWNPHPPTGLRGESAQQFLAAYRLWRDGSLADYAQRTGHLIAVVEL